MTVLSGVSPPRWWSRGRDGWPLLAMVFGGRNTSAFPDLDGRIQPSAVCLLEASTGRLAHLIENLSSPGTADLDGDGIDDLWGAVDGELRAFEAEEADAARPCHGARRHEARGIHALGPPGALVQPGKHDSPFIRHPSSFLLALVRQERR